MEEGVPGSRSATNEDSDQQSDQFNLTSRSLLHALGIREPEDDQSECTQVRVAYTVVEGTRGRPV